MSYANTSEAAVNDCIVKFAPLVKRLAHYMMASLPPSVELDDVIQSGMLGLLDAARRFQDGFGAQFETYAVQRIRGAMLDELRGNDWMSRGDRRQQRAIETAVHKLEQRLGRAPSESEIAAEMGLKLAQYQELLGKVRGTQLVYLEDMSGDEGDDEFLDRPNASGDQHDPPESPKGGRDDRAAVCENQPGPMADVVPNHSLQSRGTLCKG